MQRRVRHPEECLDNLASCPTPATPKVLRRPFGSPLGAQEEARCCRVVCIGRIARSVAPVPGPSFGGPWEPGQEPQTRAIDNPQAPPVQTGSPQSLGPSGAAPATPAQVSVTDQALQAALDALAQQCHACRRCPLALGRQQVVLSRGNPQARLMLIGEAPGAQEDELGQPFVGRSGQLLDQLLAAAGLDSNRDAYICNGVKCRPPDNRKPTALELAACRPFLQQQIALVQPQVLVLVGATALRAVLGPKGPISQLRGQWQSFEGRACMPIFHPSYLLRNGSSQPGRPRDLTRLDLVAVREHLQGVS